MIHQEMNLIDELSVAENIFLGREGSVAGLVRMGRIRRDASALLRRLNASFGPKALVKDLSVAEKQLVEIAKAVSCRASVLIMDEPHGGADWPGNSRTLRADREPETRWRDVSLHLPHPAGGPEDM